MATKDGVAYFPQTSPVLNAPAAYRLVVWVYEKDGQWIGEAPEVALTETADNARDALTKVAGAIGHLRNNKGKPKPMVLASLEGKTAPEGAIKRIIAVS